MAEGAHHQQGRAARLGRARYHLVHVTGFEQAVHLAAGAAQGLAGLVQPTLGRGGVFARHHQQHRQAFQQWLLQQRLRRLARVGLAVKCQHHALRRAEVVAGGHQHRATHAANHLLDMVVQVDLARGGVAGMHMLAQHHQLRAGRQLLHRFSQLAVAQPAVQRARARGFSACAGLGQHLAAGLLRALGQHRVGIAQALQQVLLCVDADGAAEIVVVAALGVAFKHMQKFQWRLQAAGSPGRPVDHAMGIGQAVDASEDFVRGVHVVHVQALLSASAFQRHRACRAAQSGRPGWRWPRSGPAPAPRRPRA